MKNLKIGAKIFLAFGIVIAFMLLSAIVVFITNTGIISNVDKVSKDSVLQTTGNALKDEFLLTRVVAIRLLTTTDAGVYDEFVKQAAKASAYYAEIYKLIDENSFLGKFRPAFEKAEADFNLYIGKAHELGVANAEEELQIEKMNTVSVDLAQYGDLILEDQISMLRGEINDGAGDINAQLRRVDRIQNGADIALNILSFRMYAREMMASFDTANMPEALRVVDEAYSITEGYNKASTIAANIQNSQMLMDAITAYRAALVEFANACDTAAALATELSPAGATALSSLSTAIEALDSAMESQVTNTMASSSSARLIVMAISILSILVAVALAVIIMKGITVPLSKMKTVMDQIGNTGNLEFADETKNELARFSDGKDEIAESIGASMRTVQHFERASEVLMQVAGGDLTVRLEALSDKDTIGISISKMTDGLNQMFGEINAATAQVSLGSKQIADSAQILAQGSTEQAAAIEQLSGSISQIAEKTKANAEKAIHAAGLADTIKGSAEKGSNQMNQMMEAVKEINQASQSINKVIKVIDDIAFQTNILALNAAVEAARAGQHGKGFAVVAEEVRNLAAKSAEAAKDTGGLIANSMEKAELGARIAGETAASLEEIVSGINESSLLVGDIARSSEEQSEGIIQVNKGIDQVAQVVQQNSATAEESAATSEEMNSQSDMLERLVAQFKLNTEGARLSKPAHRQLSMPERRSADDEYGKY